MENIASLIGKMALNRKLFDDMNIADNVSISATSKDIGQIANTLSEPKIISAIRKLNDNSDLLAYKGWSSEDILQL